MPHQRWHRSVVMQEEEPEMRARTLAALMAVLLFAWPVAAQEQRGSIEGIVKDTSGAVLPGVSVEAKAENGAAGDDRQRRERDLPLPVGGTWHLYA